MCHHKSKLQLVTWNHSPQVIPPLGSHLCYRYMLLYPALKTSLTLDSMQPSILRNNPPNTCVTDARGGIRITLTVWCNYQNNRKYSCNDCIPHGYKEFREPLDYGRSSRQQLVPETRRSQFSQHFRESDSSHPVHRPASHLRYRCTPLHPAIREQSPTTQLTFGRGL